MQASKNRRTVTVGDDFIGKFDLVFPLRFKDPVGDVHPLPEAPVVTSSDPSVATASVYNLMLMVHLVADGTTDVDVEYANPSGHGQPLKDGFTLVIAAPQPTELDIDVDAMEVQPVSQ